MDAKTTAFIREFQRVFFSLSYGGHQDVLELVKYQKCWNGYITIWTKIDLIRTAEKTFKYGIVTTGCTTKYFDYNSIDHDASIIAIMNDYEKIFNGITSCQYCDTFGTRETCYRCEYKLLGRLTNEVCPICTENVSFMSSRLPCCNNSICTVCLGQCIKNNISRCPCCNLDMDELDYDRHESCYRVKSDDDDE